MFGFLNIYKPKGMTSHDVVAILRRITQVKQIGHAGTLDPFAEGVLPIGVGKATRLIEYLDDDKAYIGTIKLGKSTTTYDSEGEVTNSSDKKVSVDEINSVLSQFKGRITQYPPIYSAIKINGKKLYEYARKGETVEVQPREVLIYKLDILKYNSVTKELEIYVECSKGTYIRSLANDIGETLGTYGYLSTLTRVKAGDFEIKESVKLEDLQSIDDVVQNLQNPIHYINYPEYVVNQSELSIVLNGNPIQTNIRDGRTLITDGKNIIAIGFTENNILKPQKVFI